MNVHSIMEVESRGTASTGERLVADRGQDQGCIGTLLIMELPVGKTNDFCRRLYSSFSSRSVILPGPVDTRMEMS